MPKKVPGNTPKLVGECSQSKFLPYGASAMLLLYWAAKYPQAQSALPHLAATTNTVAGWLSVSVGGQAMAKAMKAFNKWWSRHVEFTGGMTLHLGKKGEQLPP